MTVVLSSQMFEISPDEIRIKTRIFFDARCFAREAIAHNVYFYTQTISWMSFACGYISEAPKFLSFRAEL